MHDRKHFDFELKQANADGSFVGLASVYGNIDGQNDIVERGAFTKTLQERGNTVPILWQHDQRSPIGRGTLTDTPQELKIEGKLTLGVDKADDAYALLKDDVISGLSIGYDVIQQQWDSTGARHLLELKLFEVSVVTFPANEEAIVSSVKAAMEKSGRTLSAETRKQLKSATEHLAEARRRSAKAHHVLANLVANADTSDDDADDDVAEVAKMLHRFNRQLKAAIGITEADVLETIRHNTAILRSAIRR